MPEIITNTLNKQPAVSVCIASYNHARFLPEMLDSVLAQTIKDFEVVVVDDGSTDSSLDILNGYAKQFPQVKVLTHPNKANKGISITTNFAINNARGKYIAFIGSDDIWCSNNLEVLVKILEDNPSLGFCYGKVYEIDVNGNYLADPESGWDITNKKSPILAEIETNSIPAISILVKKECFDRVGLMDENVVYGDWELWIRLLAHYDAAFVDKCLGKHRHHEQNTSIGILPEKQFRHTLSVLDALKSKRKEIGGKLTESMINVGYKRLYKTYAIYLVDMFLLSIKKGNFTEGLSYISKAFRFSPLTVLSPGLLMISIKRIGSWLLKKTFGTAKHTKESF